MTNRGCLRFCIILLLAMFLVPTRSHAEELTARLVKERVLAACGLIEAEGPAAIPKIKDPKGEFRFAEGEGYVWIHNLKGRMVMHPIKPALDGTDIVEIKDTDGMYIFPAMNKLVQEHGEGWISYKWLKVGENRPSRKISFVKLVVEDEKSYVVGSGLYDVGVDEIRREFPLDAVYE